MKDREAPMLVVLDSDEDSLAPLTVAQRYAPSTVLLTSWAAKPLEIEAEVISSTSAEPKVSEAVRLAAQRGISWIGMRRSLIPPQELLGELLIATAQHTTDDIAGFAVLLADGDPQPFTHILAIVDRGHGPMSGLLAYAAVAIADRAGAKLDILIIGTEGENPHTEDEHDALAVNREREVYEAAVDRAREGGVSVEWITAASVTEPWPVIADQLSQHAYDLIVDDLGDVSLAKVRKRASLQEALATGSVGEVPLKLLTEADCPVLLVIDEIRMRWTPDGALRKGAVAAIALGVMSTPVTSGLAAAQPTSSVMAVAPAKTGDLKTDLEAALDVAQQEADAVDLEIDADARAADASRASRGGAQDGARADAQAQAASPADVQAGSSYGAGAAASQAPTDDKSDTSEATEGKDTDQKEKSTKDTDTSAKKEATKVQAPAGGATPGQVAKAKASAAEDRAELAKAKLKKQNVEDSAADLAEDLVEAEAGAIVARDDLEAATMSHAEALAHAEVTAEAASGVGAVLPGSPGEQEVAAAAQAAEAASERLDTAIATGEESLETLADTEEDLTKQEKKLDKRKDEVKETRAAYEKAQEKADAYQASLAKTRQSPVAKGDYRITARYGQSGGYWSSGSHTGLDFAGPSGTSIKAATSGTVVSTGYNGAYGNQIVIDHGNGFETSYSHLSSIGVAKGQKVSTGDHIGKMGSTGNSTGSHLHFEVLKNGNQMNPEAWLGW